MSLIINISALGLFTFLVLHILRNLKRRNLLDDIAKVEAKMAALRLNLRARVKKKSHRFRATYPQTITKGDPIDLATNQLMEITFEKNSDFQDYVDLCKKINSYIDVASIDLAPEKKTALMSPAINSDLMGTDFKNEINIARIINDLVSISKILNKVIVRYNNFDKKTKIQTRESIYFTSLFELQKVFKSAESETTASKSSVKDAA